jgi:hypothetical protein
MRITWTNTKFAREFLLAPTKISEVRPFLISAFATAAAVLALGCPESTRDVDACAELYDSEVAQSAKCGGPSATIRLGSKAAWTRSCTALINAPGAATNSLRAAFQTCIEEVNRATCFADPGTGPACVAAVDAARGTLPKGRACADETQCMSGSCNVPENTTSACGTCAESAADGAICYIGNGASAQVLGCVPGSRCDVESKRCLKVVLVSEGANCADAGIECGLGLACTRDVLNGPRKCSRLASKGEACIARAAATAVGKPCAADLNCVGRKCMDRSAIGASCTLAGVCKTEAMVTSCDDAAACVVGASCDPTSKKCVVQSTAALGAACAAAGVSCDVNLYCNKDRLCVSSAPEGAACAEPPADGSPPNGRPCELNLRCTAGKCVFDDPVRCK